MSLISNFWSTGNIGCVMAYAVRDTSFMASSMTLALLGIERYKSIDLTGLE